jgi:hypothetical protein
MTEPFQAAGGHGTQDAILFGVSADLVYNIFSATNSSPQTTELFAKERGQTLWKYVRLGAVQAGVLIGLMAMRAYTGGGGWARAVWAVGGGGVAGVAMWMMYAHALASGGGSS